MLAVGTRESCIALKMGGFKKGSKSDDLCFLKPFRCIRAVIPNLHFEYAHFNALPVTEHKIQYLHSHRVRELDQDSRPKR
jgi:hypothetical protein